MSVNTNKKVIIHEAKQFSPKDLVFIFNSVTLASETIQLGTKSQYIINKA